MSPRPLVLEHYGFYGMDDMPWGERDEKACVHIENMMPESNSGETPFALVTRPGVTAVTCAGTGRCQAMGQLLRTDGVYADFAIIAGEIWSSLDGAASFTKVVTTANLTTAGVTLTSTNRVFWCEYAGTIVFNDETNQPFQWDGQSGATGLTLLTNAPSTCVGRPTVYYGKLFFIKSENVLVWSEENAANTGYESSGYNNTWQVAQTSSEPINAIYGTNRALYYFRREGIGAIYGAVTPDFSTTGTHDAVSANLGVLSKDAVAFDAGRLFFMDREMRPWALTLDGEFIPLWQRARRYFTKASTTAYSDPYQMVTFLAYAHPLKQHAAHAFCRVLQPLNVVLFFFADSVSGTVPLANGALVFQLDSLTCVGWWSFKSTVYQVSDAWVQLGTTGVVEYLVAGFGGSWGTTPRLGRMLHHEASYQDHGFTFPCYVYGPLTPGPDGQNMDFVFERVSVLLTEPVTNPAAPNVKTRVTLDYFTSERRLAQEIAAAQTLDVQNVVTTVTTSGTERHAVFGTNGFGRWMVPRIQLQRFDNAGVETDRRGLVLHGYRVAAFPRALDPEIV